jgi:hypothetical protein
VALLGTTLSYNIRKTLFKYKKVYLVLDKDASTKAIVIKREIGAGLKVRFINQDLKVLTTSQIRTIMK